MCSDFEAPAPDPRLYEIMDKQVAMSGEALNFFKEMFSQGQERQKAMDVLSTEVQRDMLDTSRTAKSRANEAYNFYMNTGRPVERQMFEDAMQADSEERVALDRNRAVADVNQAFSSARAQGQRALTRMGVNPNSGRFAELNKQLILGQALGQAGAANKATTTARDRGVALRAGASNFARGMPNTSMQFTQQGTGAIAGAQNSLAGANAGFNANAAMMGSGFGVAGAPLAQAGSLGANIYGTSMQGWNAAQQAAGSEAAGLGSLVGLAMGRFADGGVVGIDGGTDLNGDGLGGRVTGPGTGTSDSVPATNTSTGQAIKLSNGEYVVPASVVKAKGTEFFDRLVRQHHRPVRQAIPMGA